MTWTEIIVTIIVVIVIILPPKYDPVIRLKEYFIKKDKNDS